MKARIATSLAAASALVATGLVSPVLAQAAPSRVPLAKSTPQWLSHARHLGKTSTAASVSLRVYLAPRGGMDNLKAAVARASTPGSAAYRKFMSAAQYHASYDPSAASVAAVSKWLTSAGLKVTGHADFNSYLTVTGSVAAAQSAFGASIDTYTHDGQTVQANSSALTMPSGVAASVLTVDGVDTTKVVMKPSSPAIPYPDAFLNGRPCSLYYGQVAAKRQADYRTPLPTFKGKTLPYSVCGYTGPQYRAAYGVDDTPNNGLGVTIAITDAYNSKAMLPDAIKYAANHGDEGWVPGQYTTVQPYPYKFPADCPDPGGWFGEQTLDVEAVHAMAGKAKVRYYASASCEDTDFLDTLARVVNEDKAQIVTNSWGDADEAESADGITAYETIFLQGALEGISFLFSSGDYGDEVAHSGIKQTDYPASDPYVTAVGGTSSAIGPDGKFVFNTGWGTQKYALSADGKTWAPVGYLYGAGGGYSTLFNRPTYQNGVVPSSAPQGRAVPDVAMDADPTTGMLIGETQTFPDGVRYGEYRIGGTSLASPLFAGMTALLVENAGGGLGLLNPTIYGQVQAKVGSFNDVKGAPQDLGNVRADYANGLDPSDGLLYSVRTFNQNSTLNTTKGWDDTTGVGVPNSKWILSLGQA